ncbi:beta-L-arabinofuranosidase domain-containing protein [Streptomyces sp. NPDC014892]|uniref:beta-L-arabinofuranosidase domain-containing protein n=1 Tax=Streptomyces sp. NPDC014892 TaxID=3364930 RepID=UPI0036FFE96E
MPGSRRRRRARTLAGALAAALLLGTLGAVRPRRQLGHRAPGLLRIRRARTELSAGFTVRRTMRAQYDADRGAGDGSDHHSPHAPNERRSESRACPNPPPGEGCCAWPQARPPSADYYERGLTNHILASRRDTASTSSPEVTYFVGMGPGVVREYGNTGTCCGGTSMENHTKYQDSVYFRSADGGALYVNLYLASTLRWPERGLVVDRRAPIRRRACAPWSSARAGAGSICDCGCRPGPRPGSP